MRIAVDARHLPAGRGIARHTRRTLAALGAAFPADDWRAFVPGRAAIPAIEGVTLVRHRLGGRALFGAAALAGRPRLDRLVGGADVALLPAPAPVAISPGLPYVVTMHDLSWIERPGDLTPYERLWHRLARVGALVRGAAAILCVSEVTRAALLERWDLEAGRVHVVRSAPGLAPAVTPRAAEAAHTGDSTAQGRPYFLAVGALEPRKAPEIAVRAFADARARGLDADLVLAGDGRLAGQHGGDGVRVAGAVSDHELAGLYRGALALVAPSWLEGFGLAPVEAAAFATPAIVADLPVYDETLGPAAVRVAPGDVTALADAMLALAADEPRRARLGAEAARAVCTLSWDDAARRTREILAEAAGC